MFCTLQVVVCIYVLQVDNCTLEGDRQIDSKMHREYIRACSNETAVYTPRLHEQQCVHSRQGVQGRVQQSSAVLSGPSIEPVWATQPILPALYTGNRHYTPHTATCHTGPSHLCGAVPRDFTGTKIACRRHYENSTSSTIRGTPAAAAVLHTLVYNSISHFHLTCRTETPDRVQQ